MVAQKDFVIELVAKTLLLVGPGRCYMKILWVDVLVSFKVSQCEAGAEKMKIHAGLQYKGKTF